MEKTLKLEEIGCLALSIALFTTLDYPWWVYLALFLTPDLAMLGYVWNPKIGAFLYNVFHHKGLAVLFILVGVAFDEQVVTLTGSILLGHAAMDRIWGFGLKYSDSFQHTHLGWINSKDKNKH